MKVFDYSLRDYYSLLYCIDVIKIRVLLLLESERVSYTSPSLKGISILYFNAAFLEQSL